MNLRQFHCSEFLNYEQLARRAIKRAKQNQLSWVSLPIRRYHFWSLLIERIIVKIPSNGWQCFWTQFWRWVDRLSKGHKIISLGLLMYAAFERLQGYLWKSGVA
jgi:hypothetical protein